MTEIDEDAIAAKIGELQEEHRDLDDMIARVEEGGTFDQLQLKRMKKRKLAIKDSIARLNNMLIPDIIA